MLRSGPAIFNGSDVKDSTILLLASSTGVEMSSTESPLLNVSRDSFCDETREIRMSWDIVPGIVAIIAVIIQAIWVVWWAGRIDLKITTLWDLFVVAGRESGGKHMKSPMTAEAESVIEDALKGIGLKKLHCLRKKNVSQGEIAMGIWEELGSEKLTDIASKLEVTMSGALYLIAEFCETTISLKDK